MQKHPAWRFILALKASGLDPRNIDLPYDGGCDRWNDISELLCDIIKMDLSNGPCSNNREIKEQEKFRLPIGAFRIFNLGNYRIYLEAYLLAGGDEKWIADALHVDLDLIDFYQKCFFDTSVFTDGIAKMAYVDSISDDNEYTIKRTWAKGPDHIKWLMGFDVDMDSKKAMSALFAEIMHKHRETENEADAMKWYEIAANIGAKLLGESEKKDFMKDLKLSLKLDKPEFPVFGD